MTLDDEQVLVGVTLVLLVVVIVFALLVSFHYSMGG